MTDERFSRSCLLLGDEALKKLNAAHVAVFGVGGVGSYIVEALVRSGVGELTLCDSDVVSKSNINRQLVALESTIGMKKTEVARARARDINPNVKINTLDIFFGADTQDALDLTALNYIADAIDTVSSKLLLVRLANEHGVPIICSMGTGNKLDPTQFEISDISKTSVCPLARVMRTELKKQGIKRLKVMYSKEQPCSPRASDEPPCGSRRQIPGSVPFVPSVAGLIIAGEIVKDIIERD